MKRISAVLILLFGTTQLYSQFELPRKSIKIDPLATDKSIPLPSPEKSINYPSIFDKPDDYSKFKISLLNKKEETPNNIMMKEQFKNPGEKIVEKLNKKDGEIQQGFRSDQFLGEFRSNSKSVKIICRDHEYPDGDRVRVLLNDKIIINNILLESDFKEVFISLSPGFNKIDFEALNQGTSGPNTAQFMVFDDNGNMISSNKWNLTTGVKATIIVVKE